MNVEKSITSKSLHRFNTLSANLKYHKYSFLDCCRLFILRHQSKQHFTVVAAHGGAAVLTTLPTAVL